MKILKWVLVVVVVLGLLGFFFGMPYMREQTKKNSPEKTATYAKNGLDLSVHYSSPFKKGRVIFGELVPYNTVWRTGANEPTTFTTATDLRVMGKVLPAGTYSLWTIPGEQQWSVVFNKESPRLGRYAVERREGYRQGCHQGRCTGGSARFHSRPTYRIVHDRIRRLRPVEHEFILGSDQDYRSLEQLNLETHRHSNRGNISRIREKKTFTLRGGIAERNPVR